MDILIKKFGQIIASGPENDTLFYDRAMKWAADNIDFEHARQFPERSQWKYWVKKKSGKAIGPDRSEKYIEYLEMMAEYYKLKMTQEQDEVQKTVWKNQLKIQMDQLADAKQQYKNREYDQ